MSGKVKKPKSLHTAVNRVMRNCPFYEEDADSDERDEMDAAVELLRSAYKEYCDRIEREVINRLRNYQDEYEQFWLNYVDDDMEHLSALRQKHRSLEDKIHGFIIRGKADIFSYEKRGFAGILSRNGNKASLMHYMNLRVESALEGMEKIISQRLAKFDQDVRTKYLNKKQVPHEILKKKRSAMYALKAKYERNLIKNHNTNVRCCHQDALIALAKEVMKL